MNLKKEVSKRYNKIAKRYSKQIYENFWNNVLEYPITVAEIKKLNVKNKKVLDVGCGSGRYTKVLVKSNAKVWGIDISKRMVEIAKRDVKEAQISIGNIYKTKFKDNFFDVIFSGLAIEYLDREKFFKEANRILKKNGILLFSMQNPYTERADKISKNKYIFRFGNYFKEENFYQYWPNFKTKMPFKHVTMQTMIRAILKNNFTIIDYIDIKPPLWSRKKFKRQYKRVIRLAPFCIMKLRKVK